MQKMKLITVAALSLAALATVSTAASAATVTAAATDMILGFEINDGAGQGATINLEFDLGPAANFTSAYSATFTQVLAADLSSTYGSNWASRANLVWGVGGVLSDGSVSNAFDLTSQTPVKTSSNAALAPAFGQVGGLAGGLNNQTAVSPGAANKATSEPNSFKSERTVTTADFGNPSFSQVGQSETASGSVGSLSLYQFTPNPARNEPLATNLGTFNLTSDGTFTFAGSAASVPEPSAYALGICAVILFVVLRRRNSIA